MILTRPQPSEGRFNADEVLVVSVQRCEMVDECFEAVVSLLTRESGFEWILSSASSSSSLESIGYIGSLLATGMSVRPQQPGLALAWV